MSKHAKKKLLVPPISKAAPGPLYQQIVDGIKREVCEGRLEPGTPLPSFRLLAEQLMVSLITVKRAYAELESDEIIFRKQGLGTFVSQNGAARSRQIKREQTEALLREALREGYEAGMDDKELLDMAKHLLKEGTE